MFENDTDDTDDTLESCEMRANGLVGGIGQNDLQKINKSTRMNPR